MKVEMYRTNGRGAFRALGSAYQKKGVDSEYLGDVVAAHVPEVTGMVRAYAVQRAAVAAGLLAAHRDTGASHIEVGDGLTDASVSLVDVHGDANNVENEVQALTHAFGLPPRMPNRHGNSPGDSYEIRPDGGE